MKTVLTTFLSLIFLFASASVTHAIINPLDRPNNIFGIHILDEHDLDDAADLVNSSGGDWGYVTVVIREDEIDVTRWTRFMEKMERLHLIPLIRVATENKNGNWEQGNVNEIDTWIEFFDRLPWYTPNRYIIVGNEPNHATEWGGEVNPEEYADYLFTFSQKLKESSSDYFVLPAGFDASAPTDSRHMDQKTYMSRMHEHNDLVFEAIDGWTSHSYPNPGFVGSVDDTGRKSIRTFEWELDLLQDLGVSKKLPVFITETGWGHDHDLSGNFLDTETISDYYKKSFTSIWTHPHIVAVTPFVLRYEHEPFAQFSWKNKNGDPYDFYNEVKNLPKVKGEPQSIVNKTTSTGSAYNFFHHEWSV